MGLDLILIVVVGLFALRGFLRGTLRAAVDLLGWVGAYAAALIVGPGLGPSVSETLGVPPLVGRGLGCLGVALLVWFAFSIVSGMLGRRRRRGPPPGALDRLGGAALGALPALVLALIVGWGAGVLRAVGEQTALDLPRSEGSRFAGVARQAVAGGAGWWLAGAGPAGAAAAEMLADPGTAVARLQTLVDEPRVRALGSDRAFWADVEGGRLDAALARPSFLEIAHASEVRQQFAALGLIPEAGVRDSLAFRAEARTALEAIGPRLHALRNDPALARLQADPEVRAQIQAGDTLSVLMHPDFRAVLGRALEAPPTGSELADRRP